MLSGKSQVASLTGIAGPAGLSQLFPSVVFGTEAALGLAHRTGRGWGVTGLQPNLMDTDP